MERNLAKRLATNQMVDHALKCARTVASAPKEKLEMPPVNVFQLINAQRNAQQTRFGLNAVPICVKAVELMEDSADQHVKNQVVLALMDTEETPLVNAFYRSNAQNQQQ
jgi:hypothetical protein